MNPEMLRIVILLGYVVTVSHPIGSLRKYCYLLSDWSRSNGPTTDIGLRFSYYLRHQFGATKIPGQAVYSAAPGLVEGVVDVVTAKIIRNDELLG